MDWLIVFLLGYEAPFAVSEVEVGYNSLRVRGWGFSCSEGACPDRVLEDDFLIIHQGGGEYRFSFDVIAHKELEVSRGTLYSYALGLSWAFEQGRPHPLDGTIITGVEDDMIDYMDSEPWVLAHRRLGNIFGPFLRAPHSLYDGVVSSVFLKWLSDL